MNHPKQQGPKQEIVSIQNKIKRRVGATNKTCCKKVKWFGEKTYPNIKYI
jgi:hypothetical protein